MPPSTPFSRRRRFPGPGCRLAAVLLALGIAAPAAAQGPAGRAPAPAEGAEAAVLAASRAYKAALDRGDAAAVRALWTEEGDIIDDNGNVLRGRDAADGIAPAADGAPRAAFVIDEVSVRLVADDVAIEDGSVTVTPPGSSTPHHGRFSATWVKTADGWKVAGLREWRTDPPETAAGLGALEWLVGDWTATVNDAAAGGPAPTIEMAVRWNPSHTFLLRETRITPPEGGEPVEVTQRIGWDPLVRRIRSWSFSSDGGHSEAVWTLEDGVWVARTVSVHPDGSLSRGINHYLYDGGDECTFQSLPTHAGTEHAAPSTMTMTRKPRGEKE